MEKISWPHHVRNEAVGLQHMAKDRNTIKKRKANCIGHCLLKHVIKGKIERRIEAMGR